MYCNSIAPYGESMDLVVFDPECNYMNQSIYASLSGVPARQVLSIDQFCEVQTLIKLHGKKNLTDEEDVRVAVSTQKLRS